MSIKDPGQLRKTANPPSALEIEWVAWLAAYPWHYFLTVTFRDLVPMHRQESVLHAVGQTLVHNFVTDRLFLVSEAHKSQTLHLHGLYRIATEREDIRKYAMGAIWKVLFDKFGRSKVEYPRDEIDVAEYATKYCLKTGGYYQDWGPSAGLRELRSYGAG